MYSPSLKLNILFACSHARSLFKGRFKLPVDFLFAWKLKLCKYTNDKLLTYFPLLICCRGRCYILDDKATFDRLFQVSENRNSSRFRGFVSSIPKEKRFTCVRALHSIHINGEIKAAATECAKHDKFGILVQQRKNYKMHSFSAKFSQRLRCETAGIIRMPLDFDSRVEVNWTIMLMMQKQVIRYRVSRMDISVAGGGRLHISTSSNSKPFCSFSFFCFSISIAQTLNPCNVQVERKQKKRRETWRLVCSLWNNVQVNSENWCITIIIGPISHHSSMSFYHPGD